MKFPSTLLLFIVLFLNGFKTYGNKVRLHMPKVRPEKDDSYICISMKLPTKQQFIVKYEPNAHKEQVHHMLLFGCDKPGSDEESWDCGEMGAPCSGYETVLFGWAKDAPALQLPEGVGFKVGGKSETKYFVLQLHYVHPLKEGQSDSSGLTVHMTPKRQPNIASIYLLLSSNAEISPNAKGIHVDIACRYDSEQDIHPFAFRTHSHELGRVITGYRIRNNTWTLLGKGDPQAPQAFYPMEHNVTIRKGDIVAARCTYDTYNSTKTGVTTIGATANDEMCNFYMMYYRDAQSNSETPELCLDQYTYRKLFRSFPKDSDVPLKSSLTSHHHHHYHHHSNQVAHKEPEKKLTSRMSQQEPGASSSQISPSTKTLETVHLKSFSNEDESPVYNPNMDEPPTDDDVTNDDVDNDDDTRDDDHTDDVAKFAKDTIFGDDLRKGDSRQSKIDPKHFDQNSSATATKLKPSVYKASEHVTHDATHDVTNDVSTSTSVSEQTTRASKITVGPTTSGKGKGEHEKRINIATDEPTVKRRRSTEGHSEPTITSRKMSNIDGVAFAQNWPTKLVQKKLGQVTGLAVDSAGLVLVFHRGHRKWDDKNNTFREATSRGTIHEATILILDGKSGKLLEEWGKDMFYLPHGLTVDHEDNVWVTDVGGHQVMKLTRKQSMKPSLLLGEKLIPGSDDKHFCKPTDVAVERSGVFYVADGYCNGRVLKFSPKGVLLKKWGETSLKSGLHARPSTFAIPHSLTLDAKRGMLYVADRENGRIQCFDTNGKFHREISSEMFGGRVFAVDYNEQGDVLYAVNGPGRTEVQGFTIQPTTGRILATWHPRDKGFSQPHAIASIGPEVYIGEVGPNRVWKLETKHLDNSEEDNYARGIINLVLNTKTTKKVKNDRHSVPDPKENKRPAIVILAIIGVPALIMLAVGVVSKIRGRKKLHKYDMMDDGLGNPSTPRNWCVSMNCCRRPYNSMEELYLMDSDSDLEIFPDVHVNNK